MSLEPQEGKEGLKRLKPGESGRLTLEPGAGPRARGRSQELKRDVQSDAKSGSSGPEAAAKTLEREFCGQKGRDLGLGPEPRAERWAEPQAGGGAEPGKPRWHRCPKAGGSVGRPRWAAWRWS